MRSKTKIQKAKPFITFLTIQSLSTFTPSLSFSEVLKVKAEGRKPASEVVYRQSGVPVFEMVKKSGTEVVRIKNIPKLDIGSEKVVEADDFKVEIPQNVNIKPTEYKKLQSPALLEIPRDLVIGQVQIEVKKITNEKNIDQIPMVQTLVEAPPPQIVETQPKTENLIEIKPDEYKMMQALIFLDYQKKI